MREYDGSIAGKGGDSVLEDLSEEAFDTVFAINLRAAKFITGVTLPVDGGASVCSAAQ